MKDNEWLQNVKKDDKIIIKADVMGAPSYRVAVVTRVTPASIIIGTEKYDKQEGHKKEAWSRSYLREYNNANITEINLQRRHNQGVTVLKSMNWDTLPLEVLDAVREVINKHFLSQIKPKDENAQST